MKKLRWQLIIIFLTGLVVGILLLSEQPESHTQLRPEPVQGGVYTEALTGEFQRLNPVLDYYNPVDRDVDRLIFSGLVRYDERGLPQPDIAESWGVSKDGTIYNFTLRSDVLWHDGVPFTSDDVVYTVELMRQGGLTIPEDLSEFWKQVQVKSLSATSLQFQLPDAYAPFLDYLTFGVLPGHLLRDLGYDQLVNAPFNLQPVGTGPFRFDRLIVEGDVIKGVVLSTNQSYYGKVPFIDQIIFRYYQDGKSALEAYREGTVQGIDHATTDILSEVLKEQNLSVYSGRMPQITMIFLNLDNPAVDFFTEPSIRRALLLGINRQWIIDHYLDGQAVKTDTPILPGTWAYYEVSERLPYDIEQAKALLKASGYVISSDTDAVRKKDDLSLKFTLLYPDTEYFATVAQEIQSNWLELNIQVNIEAVPYDQLINERLEQRDYEAALVDINLARSPDPDPYPFWSQVQMVGGQNYSQWDNKMASEYLEQARVTNDISERERLYHNFQVLFSQELPSLPLYYPVYSYAVDSQIKGIRVGPLFDSSDRFSTVENWYLEARLTQQQVVLTPTVSE